MKNEESIEKHNKMKRNCPNCTVKEKNGNCPISGSDGYPVQCVGPWVEDKYYFLERYLNASCEARRKFSDKGNAVYIDLYSGPGKCIIRDDQKEIDSGGIRAIKREEAPFNQYYYHDLSPENIIAIKKRLTDDPRVHVEEGNSNELVKDLVAKLMLQHWRYHFAFVDPFGAEGLKFSALKSLAKLQRMDMLINFPMGSIKRNIKAWMNKENTILDHFLGTDAWRKRIKSNPEESVFNILLDVFKQQLTAIGYPEDGLKLATSDKTVYLGLSTVGVKNT